MPRLVVEKGRDKGKVLRLRDNGVFLVGRDVRVNLRLTDAQASRRHFKVTCRLGEHRIEDLDSSNGTFVNGRRIRSVVLAGGDKVELGETVFFFLDEEGGDEQTARKGELTGREVSGYRIGRLLGRGGMGTVYEAIQISLERTVAFKVLAKELAEDTQFVERFAAEARAAGGLNHPNIVQVYDVGSAQVEKQPTIRYYSMEYMARGSVEDLLRRDRRLTFAKALPILFDAARGLEYAERHGVVHRDIKPQNLFISEEGIVKIGDLGIAQRKRLDGETKRDDSISGSPHYIAPEQARGEAIDGRADLYALGVSLYEMLAGELPFDGASAREVILKHLNEQPPPLESKVPDAPPEALGLVERLMAKERAQRLPSARQLLQELVTIARRCELPSDTRIRIEAVVAGAQEIAALPAPEKKKELAETDTSVGVESQPGTPGTTTAQIPTPAEGAPGGVPATRVSRASARWLVAGVLLAVIALGAGIAGFFVVRSIRHDQATRRRAAEDRVAKLRADLETGKLLDETEIAVVKREVLAPLERDGYRDLSDEVAKLIADMTRRRELAARQAAEKDARERFAALEENLNGARATKPPTEKSADALDEIAAALRKLATDAAATAAGKSAAELATKVEAEARAARDEISSRVRRAEQATDAFGRRKEAVERLVDQRRYRDARAQVRDYESEWKDVDETGERVRELTATIDRAARKDLDDARVEAARFIGRGSYDDARRVYKRLKEELDEGPLGREVRAELEKIDATERRLNEQSRKRAAEADKPRLDDAWKSVAPAAAERRFADGVKTLEAMRSILETDAGRERLDRRARRLRAAQDGIDRIVGRVRARGAKSGIRRMYASVHEASIEPCPAVEANESSITFQVRDARRTLRFADATADELRSWCMRTIERQDDAAGWAASAAMMLELGHTLEARSDVLRATQALAIAPDPRLGALVAEIEEDAKAAASGEGEGGDKPEPEKKPPPGKDEGDD